ncbi:MAG: YggT family protein [Roseovarius sp.]|nr:YggT family protein [Roseovarius sp.]MCY4207241.1 YggT family protein [Roseovarius sp.]MCY4292365.1 YggT family protein [Roseovarius sp.]MCY4315904.1 YggT family protein [Roseovarius sp.]
MIAIYGPLRLILDIAFIIVIIHVVMSWLISFQILNIRQQFVAQIWYGLNRLLSPLYDPMRQFLPDTRPLDLAPLAMIVIVVSLRDYILPAILL